MSFETDNEERRIQEQRKKNIVKRYCVSTADKVFYVGSPDVLDPYSGKPIYESVPQDVGDLIEDDSEIAMQSDELNATSDSSDDGSVFDTSSMSAEDLQTANEIYQRLMNEAAADELAKQAEIEAIKMQQEASEADYNAETGSYSGLYGKKPMSQSESDALASIMDSNNSYTKSFDDLLAEAGDQ